MLTTVVKALECKQLRDQCSYSLPHLHDSK